MASSASIRPLPFLRTSGLAAAVVFLLLVARFWHPVFGFTRFLQLDASNDSVKIAAFRHEPVYVYRNTGGYDGLYYAQIAYHPALDDPELAPAIDNLAYRARRILPPALAWLLAAGQPAWIVQVYALLNVAAWLVLAVLLWRPLASAGSSGLVAWLGVMFSAGALGSVRFALTDLIALTFVCGALLAVETRRGGPAAALLAAAGLARETSLLALAGLVEAPWFSRRNLARMLVVIAPLAVWLGYVRWRVGPADPGWGNFAPPFTAFLQKLASGVGESLHPDRDHRLLTWASFLATLGLATQAAFILSRWRLQDPWWRTGLGSVGLMVFLGTAVWHGFPGAATRVLLPLTLAFNVLAVRRRAALAWLIVGNLAVGSGLLMLLDVHHDPRELAAGRAPDCGVVVRTGDGWFDAEHTLRHRWAWSGGHGSIEIESWPRTTRPLRLEFGLRGISPRIVAVTQDGIRLWRGPAGVERAMVAVDLQLRDGHARLEFADDPAVASPSTGTDERPLAFAVYDLRVTVPESGR